MTKRMKKIIVMVAMLFLFGGTAAVAAAVWPATCTSNGCVNSHLNNLNTRVKGLEGTALTKRVVVTESYDFDAEYPWVIETLVACGTPDPTDDRPFKGWAVSGGLEIQGETAEQWHIYSSGPPNLMNSWPVSARNMHYEAADPLPTVTAFAVCLK